MRKEWHPEAIEEFLKLDQKAQEYINSEIEKLPEKGLNWKKVERIKREKIGLDAYKIKLKPGKIDEINHRIIFKIKNDNKYTIVKIGRRPSFYNLKNLEEAKKRI